MTHTVQYQISPNGIHGDPTRTVEGVVREVSATALESVVTRCLVRVGMEPVRGATECYNINGGVYSWPSSVWNGIKQPQ